MIVAATVSGSQRSGAAEGAGLQRTQAKTDALSSTYATCGNLRLSTENLQSGGEERVDLSVSGSLVLVEFDGTLAYLVLCAPPDPQVLCVTYATNGLEVGDAVIASGNYRRPDPDYVLLDPCLASRPGAAEQGENQD